MTGGAARRLLAFAGVLLVVFVAAYGIGSATGSDPAPTTVPAGPTTTMADHEHGEG